MQRDDRGAVTAELAVLLPVVVLLVGMLLTLTAGAVTQLRCADAARSGARAAALGEDDAEVAGVVRRVAGDGARTAVVRSGEWVVVTVEAAVGPAVPALGGFTVRAEATSRAEP